jgi:hypothetical protein
MLTSLFLNLLLLNYIFESSNLILAHDLERYSCDFLVANDDDFPSCEMIEERGCSVGSSYEGYYYDSEKKYGTANIIISSNVTKIKEYAFIDCFAIANVSFENPSSLKVIEDNAFDGCYSIESINIPSSVEIIGNYAFTYTNRLKHIYFENDTNIRIIGNCALSSSLIIPLSVKNKIINISKGALENCYEFFNNVDNTNYISPISESENYTQSQNIIYDDLFYVIYDDFIYDDIFDDDWEEYNAPQLQDNKYNFTTDSYMEEDSYMIETNTTLDILLDIIPDGITNTTNLYNVYLNFSKLYAYIVSLIPVSNFTNTFQGPFLRFRQKYGTISFNNATGIFWLHTNNTSYSINHLLA